VLVGSRVQLAGPVGQLLAAHPEAAGLEELVLSYMRLAVAGPVTEARS
jgi:hypothetical protein